MERLAFVFETSWNFYELEQSVQVIPEESPQPQQHHLDDYEYQPDFEECIEEPEVKQVSRFFRAIRNWLDENPLQSDVVMAHPGGWIF